MKRLRKLIDEHLKSKQIYAEDPPWTVKPSSLGGRGLFAGRDINAGEIIFRDNPLLLGPRSGGGGVSSTPICVVCFAKTDPRACSRKCALPVCSKGCENSAPHKLECGLIRSWKNGHDFSKLNPDLLKCLTPVRALLLDENQRALLESLEGHRRTRPSHEVEILKERLSMHVSGDEELLLELACRALDTNAFEVLTAGDEGANLRAIYPLASIMNHNCTPNTMHGFDSRQDMTVKATVFIPEGTEIVHCYTKFLWGTCVRRSYLSRTKGFLCKCDRCKDPTEFGTNLGGLGCLKCGAVSSPVFLDEGDDGKFKIFALKCSSCEDLMSAEKGGIVMNMLGTHLGSFEEGGGGAAEEMLKFLKGLFLRFAPSSNQIAVQLKCKLVWMLGHAENYFWTDLSGDLLNEKENICRELLQLLRTLGAGQSKMRGLLLYELYCCLRERQRRIRLHSSIETGNGENVPKEGESEFEDMADLFHESRIILMDDVHTPPEIRAYNNKYGRENVQNGLIVTNGHS